MAKILSISHDTFDDCLITCRALENMIKGGKYRMLPTPNAAGEWDVGYVAAEHFEEAMKDRRGRIIIAGPREIANYDKRDDEA